MDNKITVACTFKFLDMSTCLLCVNWGQVPTLIIACHQKCKIPIWNAIWKAYRQCINVPFTLISSWYAFRQVFLSLLGNHWPYDHLTLYLYLSICIREMTIWEMTMLLFWRHLCESTSRRGSHSNHFVWRIRIHTVCLHFHLWQHPLAAITVRPDARCFIRDDADIFCFSPARW